MNKQIIKLCIAALTLTVALGSGLGQVQPEPYAINGEVLDVTDEGVLVLCSGGGGIGRPKPNRDEIVFINGDFAASLRRQLLQSGHYGRINCEAYLVGTFEYTTVSGARREVREFRLRQ